MNYFLHREVERIKGQYLTLQTVGAPLRALEQSDGIWILNEVDLDETLECIAELTDRIGLTDLTRSRYQQCITRFLAIIYDPFLIRHLKKFILSTFWSPGAPTGPLKWQSISIFGPFCSYRSIKFAG